MPEAHQMIRGRLEHLHRKHQGLIAKIEKELSDELTARGIEAKVEGREKNPYSVWRKMERKSIAFEQLSDIFGFRVVVNTIEQCYRVIGVVHTKWPTVPLRFKDYISTPKENDYQSIHTTVVGPGRQRVELQVRTNAMDDIASNGIAAHVLYKDDVPVGDKETLGRESRAYQWLRRTIAHLADGDSPEEFLEHTKLELFQDQVFCFTPKGQPDRPCRAARRRSISPMRCIPMSAIRRSARRSMEVWRRCCPNCRMAMRSKSCGRTAKCRRLHGKILCGPARPSPAIRRATRDRRAGAVYGPRTADRGAGFRARRQGLVG